MARRPGGYRPHRRGRKGRASGAPTAVAERPTDQVLELPAAIVVGTLAEAMKADPVEVIKQLMRVGIMATVNNVIDFETAATAATTMGHRVRRRDAGEADADGSAGDAGTEESRENYQPRPPVATILGHVDHGKTTLLDAIRETNVVGQEVGGITQHIGAYQVEYNDHPITFLDTPGHEAFTAMRARGAQATDVAILVVAADDGVMPQTREAIDHAKAAGVPIIVAVNKMDMPDADPERVKRQLTEHGLVAEDWGGDIIVVPVSAKTGTGIDDLLQNLLVTSEVLELAADPDRPAAGVVIEARLDKSRGPMATVLVQQGTLRVGDSLVAGDSWGRIKAMLNDAGRRVREAPPATPVAILGLSQLPEAGDPFMAVQDERAAKALVEARRRRNEPLGSAAVSLEAASSRIQSGEAKDLRIVLKCDVQGSIDAVKSVLASVSSEQTQVQILHAAAGTITDGDILLATASQAVVVGFNTRVEPGARALAEQHHIQVRLYDIIYQLSEDIERALHGMLEPVEREVADGRAIVRAIFSIGRRVKIAGCQVTDGRILRASHLRVRRNDELLHTGPITSLKRFKDDVREVGTGFECGIAMEGFADFLEDDTLEAFHMEIG